MIGRDEYENAFFERCCHSYLIMITVCQSQPLLYQDYLMSTGARRASQTQGVPHQFQAGFILRG
jgi:hypothetical protein